VSDFAVQTLLSTPTVLVRDVLCAATVATARERNGHDHQLAFPYRGVYVRTSVAQCGRRCQSGAVLQRIRGLSRQPSVAGGDATLAVTIDAAVLREIAPRDSVRDGEDLAFVRQRLRIDPRAQALVALLRHSLARASPKSLEAESLALTLAQRALGPAPSHRRRRQFRAPAPGRPRQAGADGRSRPALDAGRDRRGGRRNRRSTSRRCSRGLSRAALSLTSCGCAWRGRWT